MKRIREFLAWKFLRVAVSLARKNGLSQDDQSKQTHLLLLLADVEIYQLFALLLGRQIPEESLDGPQQERRTDYLLGATVLDEETSPWYLSPKPTHHAPLALVENPEKAPDHQD